MSGVEIMIVVILAYGAAPLLIRFISKTPGRVERKRRKRERKRRLEQEEKEAKEGFGEKETVVYKEPNRNGRSLTTTLLA